MVEITKLTLSQTEYYDNPIECMGFGFISLHKDYGSISELDIDVYDYSDSDELLEAVENKGVVAVKVFAYIHGSIALSSTSFNCRWDSGVYGILYANDDVCRDIVGKSGELDEDDVNKVKDFLYRFIDGELNAYVSGRVYDLILYDSDDNVVTSAGVFYGNGIEDDITDFLKSEGFTDDIKLIDAIEYVY